MNTRQAERAKPERKQAMTTSKSYNGFKNRSQWNQSLWINNDEGLYNMAKDFCKEYKREDAVHYMLEALNSCDITHTPDGVKWSKAGIRAAMQGM